jgi:MFS transporter, DHA1 family, multidrug resistance protein
MSTFAIAETKERRLPAGFSMAGLTFVLATLSWIGAFSIDTYLPSLPAISSSLGVTIAQVQQTMTAYLILFSITSLCHGALSDAYGRRRLTLISLTIYTAASIGCALSNNLHSLIFFRGMQGATAGAGMIVGRAVVRDLFEGAEAQRLMAHVATIFTIAPVLAPVLGGWLQVWRGWRFIFVFMALLSGSILLGCLKALPETLPRERRQRLKPHILYRSYREVLTSHPFLLACGSMAFTSVGFFIYVLSAPIFLMKHLHLRETQFLWLFLPVSIAMLIGAWISGRFAGKISGKQTIYAGYGVMAVAAVGNVLFHLMLPPIAPWSIVPIFVYIAGMSLAGPTMTLLSLDLFPNQRGLAASCQGFIALVANTVVSAFVSLVWTTPLSLALTQLVMLSGGIATVLLYTRSLREGARSQEPEARS